MFTENNMEVKRNNLLKIPRNEDKQFQFPEHVHKTNRTYTPGQNMYSTITGSRVDNLRETNNVNCFHPTQRVPIVIRKVDDVNTIKVI